MTAETFLKAFLKIDKFVWKGLPISSWLYRIATNEANQFFRQRKYKPVALERIVDIDLIKQTDSEEERLLVETELQRHADFILVQQKLKLLEIRFQEVIALRYFENKDNR